MAPESRRGPGAYRCGCGARIQISTTTDTARACAASDCRTAPVTSGTVPLCVGHRDELMRELAPLVSWDKMLKFGREMREDPEWKPSDREPIPMPGRRVPGNSVVYFAVNGDRVKIGYTTRLRARMSALSLSLGHVALTLPGGAGLEAELHHRFAAYRIGGSEWFHYTDIIRAFIAENAPQDAERGTMGS